MKCGNCHTSVISLTALSATFVLLSIISMISCATIAKIPDYDTNSELETISNENNLMPQNSVKQNYEYLKEVVSKRANLHYLQNVLAALDNKLEKIQEGLFRSKRLPPCLSGLPAGDCENNHLEQESLGQNFLKPGGGRNPGRK